MNAKVIIMGGIMAATAAAERLRNAVAAAGASVEDLADAIVSAGQRRGVPPGDILQQIQESVTMQSVIAEKSPPPEPMLPPFMAMSAGLGYDIPQVFLSSGRHHTTSRRPAIPGKRARSQRERSRRRKGARAKNRS